MIRTRERRHDIDSEAKPRPRKITTRLELPAATIFRVILTLAIIWLLTRLWSMFLLAFVAMIVSAALYPLVIRVERRGMKRPYAVLIVYSGLIAVLALVLLIVVPPLVDDFRQFAKDLPDYVNDGRRILHHNQAIYTRLQGAAQQGSADPSSIFSGFLSVGASLVGGIRNFFVVLVFSVYILIDGERVYEWLIRYIPNKYQDKLDETIPAVSSVISGYVSGQLINSTLFGIFAFTLLTIMNVPQAAFLAILAAFLDAVPIAGVLIATIPAVLLALSESVTAAIVVVIGYTLYQQFENYVVVPRVYRATLQISSFAVLVAILIGGELLGLAGVILALPVAAAIPVVERIWIGDDHPWRVRGRRQKRVVVVDDDPPIANPKRKRLSRG